METAKFTIDKIIPDVSVLFDMADLDLTEFQSVSEKYTPTQQGTFTTGPGQNNLEIHIPGKAVFLRDFSIIAKIKRYSAAGAEIAAADTDAASQNLPHAAHLIERVRIMHGRSGEELGGCSNHFHKYMDMKLQLKDDAEEYGYYCAKDGYHTGGTLQNAAVIRTGTIAEHADDTAPTALDKGAADTPLVKYQSTAGQILEVKQCDEWEKSKQFT